MTIESISMLSYLVAAIFFILALRGLSSPTSARSGNLFGIVGMIIAVLTTLWTGNQLVPLLIFAPLIIGGGIGIYVAKKVEMTKMPELVAFMHSFVGLAAVLIASAAVLNAAAVSNAAAPNAGGRPAGSRRSGRPAGSLLSSAQREPRQVHSHRCQRWFQPVHSHTI